MKQTLSRLNTAKPLDGVIVTGPNWKTIPNGLYILKPLSWSIEQGKKNQRPRSVLLCEIVLPEKHAGVAVRFYCNATYNPTLKRPVFARNSKLVRTFEHLFPNAPGGIDESGGLLLQHYFAGLVTVTTKSRKGGKLIDKPKERHYSKVEKLVAVGPRVGIGPLTRVQLGELRRFLREQESLMTDAP